MKRILYLFVALMVYCSQAYGGVSVSGGTAGGDFAVSADYVPATIEFKWGIVSNNVNISFAIYDSSLNLLTNGQSSIETGPGSSSEDSASFTNCDALIAGDKYHVAAGSPTVTMNIVGTSSVEGNTSENSGTQASAPDPFSPTYDPDSPFVFVVKNAAGDVLLDSEDDFTSTEYVSYEANQWKTRTTSVGGYECETL